MTEYRDTGDRHRLLRWLWEHDRPRYRERYGDRVPDDD